jgi:methionine-rich copper-binding protein CopC
MGAELDDPISEATIDFGEEISDDLEMALLYDTGDGEIEEVESEVAKVDPTTGRLEFDPLDREGRYFVRYLATIPADGHVVAGAVTFDFGEPRGSGAGSATPWILFGIAAVPILGVGAWLSRRQYLAATADATDGAARPADTEAARPADTEAGETVPDERTDGLADAGPSTGP